MPQGNIVSRAGDDHAFRRRIIKNVQREIFIDNVILCNETINQFLKHKIVKAETIAELQDIKEYKLKNATIFDAIVAQAVPIRKVAAALFDCGHTFVSYYINVETSETAPIFDVESVYKQFPKLEIALTRDEKQAFTNHLNTQFEDIQKKTAESLKEDIEDVTEMIFKYHANKEPLQLIKAKSNEIIALQVEVDHLSVDEEMQRREAQDKIKQLEKNVADIMQEIESVNQRMDQTEKLSPLSLCYQAFENSLQEFSVSITNFLADKNPHWKTVISDKSYIDPQTGKMWTLSDKVLYGMKLVSNYANDLMHKSHEYRPLRKDLLQAASMIGIRVDVDVVDVEPMFTAVARQIKNVVTDINHHSLLRNAVEVQQQQNKENLDEIKKYKMETNDCELCINNTRQLIKQKERELSAIQKVRENAATQTHTGEDMGNLSARSSNKSARSLQKIKRSYSGAGYSLN